MGGICLQDRVFRRLVREFTNKQPEHVFSHPGRLISLDHHGIYRRAEPHPASWQFDSVATHC